MSDDNAGILTPPEGSQGEGGADKPAGQFLSDRAKQVGRDGAYLELECMDAVSKAGAVQAAKMVVLSCMRLELSEEGHVAALKGILGKVAAGEYDDDLGEMTPEQKSFYVFRRIFEIGLLEMGRKCGVAA